MELKISQCTKSNQAIIDCITVDGCCPACVTILEDGEECDKQSLFSRCNEAKGFQCDNSTNKCIKVTNPTAKCVKQYDYRLRIANKYHRINEKNSIFRYADRFTIPLPQCDLISGNYKPKQCIGSICFCVNVETGKRLFGHSERVASDKLGCRCTQTFNQLLSDYREKLDFFSDIHPHCDSLGNFQRLQCSRNICFCADEYTGKPIAKMSITATQDLMIFSARK
ncbi:uncharacterized protein B4U80_14091 [Leptotrombidium deliense]|uniref:Thyroglobulin type-1 domain-containing protein n=1 Tax=Leptotrombidium deliense TaxID=299467 RepID=A0A443S2W3_9ACAR|nr:uncharacterized protein B4U80_14091 [Leptotrombidium deliense]